MADIQTIEAVVGHLAWAIRRDQAREEESRRLQNRVAAAREPMNAVFSGANPTFYNTEVVPEASNTEFLKYTISPRQASFHSTREIQAMGVVVGTCERTMKGAGDVATKGLLEHQDEFTGQSFLETKQSIDSHYHHLGHVMADMINILPGLRTAHHTSLVNLQCERETNGQGCPERYFTTNRGRPVDGQSHIQWRLDSIFHEASERMIHGPPRTEDEIDDLERLASTRAKFFSVTTPTLVVYSR